MKTPIQIAAFIKRHWPACRLTPRDILVSWVEWYVNDGRCGVVLFRGKIIGVGLVRLLEEKKQQVNEYAHFEGGEIAWIELVVCKQRRAMQALWGLMLGRCKGVTQVGWKRRKYTARMRLLPLESVSPKLLGGAYGW